MDENIEQTKNKTIKKEQMNSLLNNKKLLVVLISMFIVFGVKAQLVNNNSTTIFLNTNAIVQVNGELSNNGNSGVLINNGDLTITSNLTNNAVINGDGKYKVAGNWINNNQFNCGISEVILDGNTQQISGSSETHYYDLTLAGTGTKTLAINSWVNGILDINSYELATEDYTMFVENTSPSAIIRTTGFVSSLENGALSRKTLSNSTYVFPVGSSIGTFRYRPVEITPVSSSPNTYTVRMANFDATSEGFNRNSKDSTLCTLNPYFYHRINRTEGNDAADISVNYNSTLDGTFTEMANWKSSALIWNNIAPVVNIGGYIKKQSWNDFSDFPYILGLKRIIVHIEPVSPVCSNEPPFNLSASIMGGTWLGDGITNPNNGTFNPSIAGAGNHNIVYALGGQCGGTDTILLTVNGTAELNAYSTNETCIGAGDGSIALSVAGGTPPYTIQWSNGSDSQNLTLLEPGNYTVTVNDSKNCSVVQTFDVLVGSADCGTPVVYIPNAFSPNDDGNNDVLYVRGKGISNFSFKIFDRWGNKVFETTNQSIGWDGTYKNLPMAAAVFGYSMEAVLSTGEKITKSGNITLVR